MKLLAALAVLATAGMMVTDAYAQTSGMERRDDRREDRQGARDEKAECMAGDEKARPECRQDKRESKRDGEEGEKDPANEAAADEADGDKDQAKEQAADPGDDDQGQAGGNLIPGDSAEPPSFSFWVIRQFACIPRPLERSESVEGGPLRYRVVHRVPLWRKGERPTLEQRVIEGDPGLSI
jgi:hypothetical protein